MTSTPITAGNHPSDATSQRHANRNASPAERLSVRRLNVMRIGYLVMGVGLAVQKWPLFFNGSRPWPLMEGVVTIMLVAMGLLALLGLRYPVKMLPILVFESLWKIIWLGVIAMPLWTSGQMDAATSESASAILWVAIVLAVTPWRYVFRQLVTTKGDPWRSGATRDH